MGILSFGLMVVTLALAAHSTRSGGRPLITALIAMAVGVGSINPLIEAVVFGVMPVTDVPAILAVQLVFISGLSLAVVAILGKWSDNGPQPSFLALTPLRIAAAAFSYTALYLAAGMAVFPFVKEFYATKTLPPLGMVLGLQLVRGCLYVLYAWPWLRLAPRNAGLVLAFVYAILGGVAPLVADGNPYMPLEVRISHLIEVGISNFIFGLVVGRLIKPAKRDMSLRGVEPAGSVGTVIG